MKQSIVAAFAVVFAMLFSATGQAQVAGLKAFDQPANASGLVTKVQSRRGGGGGGHRGSGHRGGGHRGGHYRHRGRGGAIAAGVAIGILGAAAAASAYDRRGDSYEYRCRRWRRWCRDGERDACYKYDNRC